MKTTVKGMTIAGLCAGHLAFAPVATNASQQTFPTPASSEFADTESSLNVPIADWPDLGRRVTIDLTAYATPSNNVQIAFGQDTNGDEDLEPEETWLVIGVDCGEPFVREEGMEEGQGGRSRSRVEVNHHSSTTTTNYNFRFKQPQKTADRFTHAKVTTRGKDAPQPTITADVRKPGVVLFVR